MTKRFESTIASGDGSPGPEPDQRRGRRLRDSLRPPFRVLRVILFAYVGIIVLLMLLERSLIFLPMRYPHGRWEDQPAGVQEIEFTAEDGTRLHGWYAHHDDPSAVILYAHGNAGNITHRASLMRRLHDGLGCSVFLFDYRGYGKSEGRPSEAGILMDGRAARDRLSRLAGVPESDIVFMGRSLGTAVAIDLAAEGGARGLVLHSGFPSMPDVAAHHYPWLPVRWLMRTRLNARERIQDYRGPLFQVHGEADRIIPFALGRQLFEAAPSDRKRWLSLGGIDHNDLPPERFYDELREFLDRNVAPSRGHDPP